MSNTRQPGYYRVKYNGKWTIGKWIPEDGLYHWAISETEYYYYYYSDNELDEIDPTPINPEPQHECHPNQVYTANTVGPNSIRVTGLLSVLSRQFMHLEPGCYISNSAGAPFAYQVIPLSVRIATVADQEAGKV